MDNTQTLLKKYADCFSDDHLFQIINTDYPEDERRPEIVTGDVIEGKIINKYYDIEYIGPNPGSKSRQAALQAEVLKKRHEEAVKAAIQASKDLKASEETEEKVKTSKGAK